MLLTIPPELLLTIGDTVPDAPLAQCCRALRRLLRHRHLVVNNRPDVLLEPWVLARVSSLRYTCSAVCPVTTILSLGARCPILETLEITSEGEHIGPAALQPLTNPCLNRFVLRMRRSLLDPGALAALVRVFAQGTLPMLTDVVLELQPYGHMDALEMRCLQPLVAPRLGLASVALLLADCTWEGDRLLRHLCPGASPEPSRLRILQLSLDDTAVSDWGLCNPLSQILRMHPQLHALTLDLNGSELSGGWGLEALMNAVGGTTAVRRLDLQLARCDLPDGRAFADQEFISKIDSESETAQEQLKDLETYVNSGDSLLKDNHFNGKLVKSARGKLEDITTNYANLAVELKNYAPKAELQMNLNITDVRSLGEWSQLANLILDRLDKPSTYVYFGLSVFFDWILIYLFTRLSSLKAILKQQNPKANIPNSGIPSAWQDH
jgi:hypothetical protein